MLENPTSNNSSQFSDEMWKKIQAAVDRTGMKAEQDFLLDQGKFLTLWNLSEQVTEFSQTPEMMALEAENTPESDREWAGKLDDYSRKLARENGLGEDEIITFQQRLGELFTEELNKPSSPPDLN